MDAALHSPGSGPAGIVRVLVADDEDDIRDLVCLAVRKAGCQVVTAASDGRSGGPTRRGEGTRARLMWPAGTAVNSGGDAPVPLPANRGNPTDGSRNRGRCTARPGRALGQRPAPADDEHSVDALADADGYMVADMPLTVAAGVDMPSPALDLALGRPLPAAVPFTDLAVVRHLEGLFLPSTDLVAEEADR